MPFRHVADQFLTKWRRSSRSESEVGMGVAHPSVSHLAMDAATKKEKGSAATATATATAAASEPEKGAQGAQGASKKTTPPALPTQPSPPLNPDFSLQGIGEYFFIEPLGQGKFSKVMLARHYMTGEKVAVKIIDKRIHDYRILSRLVREIALMEALDHPNIVRLYETFETADSLFLIMEYVQGVNLDEHLQQRTNRALNDYEARNIFRQVIAAVDYCHSRWVVHRDLKAPNILLKADGQVKLADFGLGNRFGLQRLKTICGSMLYYSPEIITGQKYVGPEVDCWCLGILLFRMTTGFEPFGHARTVGELKKDVVSGQYPMPNNLSIDLQNTIRKCMTLDRRRRLGVQQVLSGDEWLTDHNRLPDPFGEGSLRTKDGGEDVVRIRTDRDRARRQYLRDMEEEKLKGCRIHRRIIYHPINSAIYFTGSFTHTPSMEENLRAQEHMRADLFQEVRVILSQVQLRPVHSVNLTDLKSPIHHIFRKFKLPEHHRLKKTTSTLNISHLYKRVTKDQINYYTIQSNVRALSSTTAVSGHSSASLSTFSLENHINQRRMSTVMNDVHSADQDEYELILLVRSACELLGITYKHETKTQLLCVLTLRNYMVEQNSAQNRYPVRKSTRDSAWTSQSDAHSATSTPTQLDGKRPKRLQIRRRSQLSTDDGHCSASSDMSNTSWSSRLNRGLKRLSLPLLQQNQNQNPHQQGIWSNSIHINSSAAPGSLASAGQHTRQQDEKRKNDAESLRSIGAEDGTATFLIEAFSVPGRHKDTQRLVALRFSNVKGTSKVFRLATGWINGVLSSNVSTSTAPSTCTTETYHK